MDWDSDFLDRVKSFEGWNPRAYGDYKQTSIGYGTKAGPGETSITKEEGERRLLREMTEARGYVTKAYPNLAPNHIQALTDLTYNAGPGWMQAGLGKLVREGRHDEAAERILQYNKAGGKTLPGLVNRRKWNASVYRGGGGDVKTLDDLLASVPNKAGEALGYINENVERSPDGFIQNLKVPGREDELDLLRQYAASQKNSSPQPRGRSWQEFGGNVLQAVGGAVAAGHGQMGFTNSMQNAIQSGNTRRSKELEAYDAAQAATRGKVDESALNIGLSALSEKRTRRSAARRKAHAIMTAGGQTPEAISQAISLLEAEGDTEAAKRLKDILGAGQDEETSRPAVSQDQVSSAELGVTGAGVSQLTPEALGMPPGAPPPAPQGQAQASGGSLPEPAYIGELRGQIKNLDMAMAHLDKGDPQLKQFEENRKSLQGQVDAYVDQFGKKSADQYFDGAKTQRKLSEEFPEERAKIDSSLAIKDRGIGLAESLLEANPDGTYSLSGSAAANTGYWGQYAPNLSSSSRKGWADIQALRNFTRADGLVELKKEAGGIGSVTESEWDTMAGRLSDVTEDRLLTDPDSVRDVIVDFKELLERQKAGIRQSFHQKYGIPDPQGGRASDGGGGSQQRTSVDDGVERDPAKKKALLKQEFEALPVGGVMVMPSGRKVRKTGAGKFEPFFDVDPQMTEEGMSP